MATTTMLGTDRDYRERDQPLESSVSGVAWPAIIAGAFTAVALSLILLALGSGFGLASVSPWSGNNPSAATFTLIAAVWLVITQWVASAIGGYLTGRLRTKWTGLHTHEVFFRDTANGFLTWAVASVVGIALLASAATSVVGSATSVLAGAAQGASQGAVQSSAGANGASSDQSAYFVDSLYRTDHPASPNGSDADSRAQAARILANGLRSGDVPAADKTYLAQLVAARTGLSQSDAEKRVDDVIAQEKNAEAKAKQAVDAARKTSAMVSIFTAVSMLIGAFIACVAAALGGKRRDASH